MTTFTIPLTGPIANHAGSPDELAIRRILYDDPSPENFLKFADWLEERGDSRADAVRETAECDDQERYQAAMWLEHYIMSRNLAAVSRSFARSMQPPVDACIDGFARLGDAFMVAVESISNLMRSMPSDPESLYLIHHDRLPGSDRTKRLRKKRRDMVNRFCEGLE